MHFHLAAVSHAAFCLCLCILAIAGRSKAISNAQQSPAPPSPSQLMTTPVASSNLTKANNQSLEDDLDIQNLVAMLARNGFNVEEIKEALPILRPEKFAKLEAAATRVKRQQPNELPMGIDPPVVEKINNKDPHNFHPNSNESASASWDESDEPESQLEDLKNEGEKPTNEGSEHGQSTTLEEEQVRKRRSWMPKLSTSTPDPLEGIINIPDVPIHPILNP